MPWYISCCMWFWYIIVSGATTRLLVSSPLIIELSSTRYSRERKYRHPYIINTIEMRSLWMEIKYIKSTARVLNRNCVNKGGLDLSKEVLWVSVGQRAADLRAVKVGDQKKFCWSAHCGRSGFKPGQLAEFFFWPPTLKARRFAALWPTEIHSTLLERSKPILLT